MDEALSGVASGFGGPDARLRKRSGDEHDTFNIQPIQVVSRVVRTGI